MILVVGGTGRLGSLLVSRLIARGLSVRVMSRDPSGVTKPTDDLIELVRGDVRAGTTLASAADGATVIVSAMHGFPGSRNENPASVDRDGNIALANVAQSTGANLILMSVVGASPSHPMELFRMKYAAEAYARELGLPLTVIRATAYLELWIDILQQTARRSGRPIVFGRGDNPINFVSVHDVAAVVDRAVSDASVRGRTLQVTGPDMLTMNQLAAALQTTAGLETAPRHLPRMALRIAAATVGRAQPALGRQLLAALLMDEMDLTASENDLPNSYKRPSTTLPTILASSATHGHNNKASQSG